MIIDPKPQGRLAAKIEAADLKARSALLADPEIKLKDVADRLDISSATFADILLLASSMGLADYADRSRNASTSAVAKRPLLSAGRVRTVVAQTPALPARYGAI